MNESKSHQIQAEQSKTRVEQSKTRVEQSKTRVEQSKTRVEQSKTRVEQSETLAASEETSTMPPLSFAAITAFMKAAQLRMNDAEQRLANVPKDSRAAQIIKDSMDAARASMDAARASMDSLCAIMERTAKKSQSRPDNT